MARNLAEAGLDISIEQLRNAYDAGTVLTRAHFAGYLYDTKQISSANEAFVKYLNPNGPYYVPRKYIKPKDAIRLIHKAGGIAVLAHPDSTNLFEKLIHAGIDGVEVWNPEISEELEKKLSALAKADGLLMVGGTEFRGMYSKKPISVGEYSTPDAQVKALMSYKTRMKKKKAATENK
jgi:predicted metal-dependent phosphoesterase TrpH